MFQSVHPINSVDEQDGETGGTWGLTSESYQDAPQVTQTTAKTYDQLAPLATQVATGFVGGLSTAVGHWTQIVSESENESIRGAESGDSDGDTSKHEDMTTFDDAWSGAAGSGSGHGEKYIKEFDTLSGADAGGTAGEGDAPDSRKTFSFSITSDLNAGMFGRPAGVSSHVMFTHFADTGYTEQA